MSHPSLIKFESDTLSCNLTQPFLPRGSQVLSPAQPRLLHPRFSSVFAHDIATCRNIVVDWDGLVKRLRFLQVAAPTHARGLVYDQSAGVAPHRGSR